MCLQFYSTHFPQLAALNFANVFKNKKRLENKKNVKNVKSDQNKRKRKKRFLHLRSGMQAYACVQN